MMNYRVFLLCIFFCLCISVSAQKIYSVDHEYQADIKVFVVDAEYKADLIVLRLIKSIVPNPAKIKEFGIYVLANIRLIRKCFLSIRSIRQI